ncbi:hypothetical protein JFL47_05140 [Haemophilus haemoglobinophilus]|nr:hypothetical protein [Canicola haemoglobinophilus]
MNILMNEEKTFGVLWAEKSFENNMSYGFIQIIIGDEIYPDKFIRCDYTLQTVFSNFKKSFSDKYFPAGTEGGDFGERSFDVCMWENLDLKNVFVIETSEMGGSLEQQLSLCLGYSGNIERLFYSFDNEKTFKEIRYRRGTVESIVNLLPEY